ncbi:MAG TPA: ROK family transcriptional regulator [Polyangiaceae bacterium]|nr:ROK family transcriptional regulator [Polyangiaceae bacterium]
MVERRNSAPLGASAPLRADVGTGNAQTRQHNLSSVITNLHHSGSLTRAELTRRTGLNRSTVAALVGELEDAGLAFETAAPEGGGVGRPSPLVHANGKVAALALNPDVDAIDLGLVGLGGLLHARVRHATSSAPSAAATVRWVRKLLEKLQPSLDECQVVGIGVAVPGLVQSETGVVTLAPHLDWHDEPLAQMLAEATGYPAFAGNDANLGMIAETVFGAGRGVSDLVYLNGSTSGIGAGVLAGGRPLWGARGYAAELGHTLINSNGRRCHCGQRGCLETEVNLHRLHAALGAEPLTLSAEAMQRAMRGGAGSAIKVEVRRQLDLLGQAIAGFVSTFNPELVLLGGFLGTLHDTMPSRLEACVSRQTFAPAAAGLKIQCVGLGENLLMVGAAELAFQALLANPIGNVEAR